MKLNTRLRVTFASIIVLPLLLTILAFLVIGITLVNMQNGKDLSELSFTTIAENIKSFVNSADRVHDTLRTQANRNPSMLEDKKYLEEISRSMTFESTYIIVRKGNELYYSDNVEKANKYLSQLPPFGSNASYNGDDMRIDFEEVNVRQVDFYFSDEEEGTVFVISQQHPLISRYLLIYMFISIFAILMGR